MGFRGAGWGRQSRWRSSDWAKPTTSAVTIGCTEVAAVPTVFVDARAFFLEVLVANVAFALFRLVADEE